MPVGGSDPIGTLGPLNAFLEMVEQAQNREIPLPDFIIVGVGTCGTMAGLLAAQKIAGVSTRIIGIRCVDKIVCNPFRISHLANQTLKYLNLSARLASSDVDLRDHGKIRYGNPNSDANDLIQLLQNTEKINLDTTYTTKVVSGMKELLKSESMKNKNILYWHTYSPSAMNEKFDPALLMTPTSGRITLPSR